MHPRNFFFSPQGGRSSYIRTEQYDRTFVLRLSRAWNGQPSDVLVEPASVGLFKSRVKNFL
nr:unnamed protein product [Callosobruchus chinensis]